MEQQGVQGRILLGIGLMGFSLFLTVALVAAHQEEGLHLLGAMGDFFSRTLITWGLGQIWSLVFPVMLARYGWNLLRSQPAPVWAANLRLLLLGLAGALTHGAIARIYSLHGIDSGGAWISGTWLAVLTRRLVEDWTGSVGLFILLATLDLLTLAIVFKWNPGPFLEGLLARMGSLGPRLLERLDDWREARAQRRAERDLARRQAEAKDLEETLERPEASPPRGGRRRPLPVRADFPQVEEPATGLGGAVPEQDSPLVPDTAPDAPRPRPVPRNGDEFEITQPVVEDEALFRAERTSEFRYKPPPVDLLADPPADEYHVTEEDLRANSEALVACLGDFSVEARVVHVHPGPVITRYDLEPAPGVKVSRIVALADDLAMKLKAERIRIIAPVPGKGAVGIELPNRVRNTVFMKSIVNTEKFTRADSPLAVVLGKTSSGEAAVADLRAMPHVLVAGQTGSGKSVCVNGIICSILLRALPTEVQFVMVDPKMIELSDYRRIADHFIAGMDGVEGDVITDPQDAVRVLAALEVEMDNRYRYLSQTGYRSIQEFNEALLSGEVQRRLEAGDLELPGRQDRAPEKMVYLVVIIDELADLMMTAGKEIETSIARLAQKARAVGIHLVVATQRPSVDVLTGLIKANFPARIAFAVRQKVDSKTIIDCMGADQLLGRGDMLYLASGSPEPVRMHNSLITGKEIRALLDHIRKQSRDFPKFRLPVSGEVDGSRSSSSPAEGGARDELFWDAAEQVILSQQGSVSVLQRRLRIGHSRASRLIDELEIAGVVGPFDGSKARQVLVDMDWIEEHRSL